ncbi:MAG TPA: hypothetical protein VLK65_25405 [Vicinamibacteria bacterium]|nr:hypothetical protein [Vicinamibacteria bacterium]
MSLSDELLRAPEKLAAVRAELRSVLRETHAAAAFLVDEEGNPFATIGNIEFPLPHPLAGLDALLEALLGERESESETRYVVERAGPRALVVLAFDNPEDASSHRARVASLAVEIDSLI